MKTITAVSSPSPLPKGRGLGRGVRLSLASSAFLCVLCASALNSSAATVTYALTNSDTSPFNGTLRVFPISTPILADGSWFIIGLPSRVAIINGLGTNTLLQGNYLFTNTYDLKPILFAAPTGTNTYSSGQLAISGYNTYNYSPGVQQLLPGTNITLSPANGLGQVTVNASGSGGTGQTNWPLISVTNANHLTNWSQVSTGLVVFLAQLGSAAFGSSNNFGIATNAGSGTNNLFTDANFTRISHYGDVSVSNYTGLAGSLMISDSNGFALYQHGALTVSDGISAGGPVSSIIGNFGSVSATNMVLGGGVTPGSYIGNGLGLTNVPGSALQTNSVSSNRFDAPTLALLTSGANAIPKTNGLGTNTTLVVPILVGLSNTLGIVTPKDFGAVGDGTTDDTTALQNWINLASQSNYLAYLPPASGPYYKITSSLMVTNAATRSLRIMGVAGPTHSQTAFDSKCQIRQFTAGADGIRIGIGTDLAPNGYTNAPDNIWIEGVQFVANTYSDSSRGIAFDGSVFDSDGNRIAFCNVRGFGTGLFLKSVAALTVDTCGLGDNGDDILLGSAGAGTSITDSIMIRACSIGGARYNGIHVISGTSIIVEGCDIGAGEKVGFPGARAVYMDHGGSLELRTGNYENFTTNEFILAVSDTVGGVILKMSGVSYASNPTITDHSYGLLASNCNLTVDNCGLGGQATDGYAVKIIGQPQDIHCSDGLAARVVYGPRDESVTFNNSLRTYFSPGPTAVSGTLSVFRPDPSAYGERLLYGAKLSPNDGNLAVGALGNVDLLAGYRTVGISATTDLATDITYILGGTIRCDTTSAGFTLTLPTVASVIGRVYSIKKISSDANTLTLKGHASETIDGSNTKTTTVQYSGWRLQSNGTTWDILP